MAHYHEVYFNSHTTDGPRVGATRRFKTELVRERIHDSLTGMVVFPNAQIVKCNRPDSQCPWAHHLIRKES